ncbi:MAG: DUF1573 domain-containing protein [Phycisphaerales bacterium]|nr:DUF1573 domain-containing protein [Phycisphaerales bacterium]
MTNRSLAVIAVVLFSATFGANMVRAQTPRADVAVEPEPARLVLLTATEPVDRGPVAPGYPVTRRVTISNISPHVLTLSIPAKSCGCLDASFDKSQLKPGEATSFHMMVRAIEATIPQGQTATLLALSDDGTLSQTLKVSLSYTSSIEFYVRPKVVAMRAFRGEPTSVKVNVRAVPGAGIPDLTVKPFPDGAWATGTIEYAADKQTAVVTLVPQSDQEDTVGGFQLLHSGVPQSAVAVEVRRRDAFATTGPLTRSGERTWSVAIVDLSGRSASFPPSAAAEDGLMVRLTPGGTKPGSFTLTVDSDRQSAPSMAHVLIRGEAGHILADLSLRLSAKPGVEPSVKSDVLPANPRP